MTTGERTVAAGADGIIQYSQNIPEHGFGFKNIANINISSIGASAASGFPLISNTIGNGLELNFSEGYKGIGSTKANYSLMSTKTAIGTILGMGGNHLDKALGKYMNASKVLSKGTSDILSGSISGAAQKIADYSSTVNKSIENK